MIMSIQKLNNNDPIRFNNQNSNFKKGAPKSNNSFTKNGNFNTEMHQNSHILTSPKHQKFQFAHTENTDKHYSEDCQNDYTQKLHQNNSVLCATNDSNYIVYDPQKGNDCTSGKSIKNRIDKIKKSDICCNYCSKFFTRNSSLNRHLNGRCKVKIQNENEKELIFQSLLKEYEAKKNELDNIKDKLNTLAPNAVKPQINKTINKTTNNNNINDSFNNNKTINNIQNNINNNINIKLVAFGKEDMDIIPDNHYKAILNKGFQAVPKMVQHVHFNKNMPQFHNVYISNMRDNYVMIYDGNKWKLNDRSEIINQLLDEKKYYLFEKFDDLIDSLNDFTIKKFRRFLDQQDEDEIANDIKREIKMILYNNKHIPENTRKLLCNENIMIE